MTDGNESRIADQDAVRAALGGDDKLPAGEGRLNVSSLRPAVADIDRVSDGPLVGALAMLFVIFESLNRKLKSG